MRVPNPILSNTFTRSMVAVSLALTMATVGAAAPVAAIAEEAPPAGTSSPSAESSATAVVPSETTTPVAVAPPVVKKRLTVRQVITNTGHSSGLSNAEVDALMWLCKRESNFHPYSHSRSGYHGLFQLSKGMAHGRPWKDPAWNTKRAIRYMRGRYGGVLKAKAFWTSHHWY